MTLYRHIATAVAFSPRLGALLAETAARARLLEARVSLIHAGMRTTEKAARLDEAVASAGLPADTEVHWMPGAPDTAILNAVRANDVDLLVAGALEKERPLRYYLGSVAHNLVRESPCSLMLLTEPSDPPAETRRIVVVTDYTEQALIALSKVVRWAELVHAERVFVVRVLSQYGTAMALAEGLRRERAEAYQTANRAQEESLLQDLVDASGASTVPVETRIIEGHTGYAAAQFVRSQGADLLVMHSDNRSGHFFERLFPSDMEWVLREIPCNLWVVREPIG